MANQEQLNLFLQGAKAWNPWWWSQNSTSIDLRGARLGKALLKGIDLNHLPQFLVDLTGIDLHEADCEEADFQFVQMTQANLRGAHLRNADLGGADLADADLSGASLWGAQLSGTCLSGAYLRGTELPRTLLNGADAIYVDARFANLSGADMELINAQKARLHFANLSDANLKRARMREAVLCEANLRNANLTDADLTGADLTGADLTGANLSHALLINVDLTGANLRKADLRYAILSQATLVDVDVSEARLGWTHLGDHDLRQVKGLETIEHVGPSSLSINTLFLSEGMVPRVFIQGTGAPALFLELLSSLPASSKDRIRTTLEQTQHDALLFQKGQKDELLRLRPNPTRADLDKEMQQEALFLFAEKKRQGVKRKELDDEFVLFDLINSMHNYAESHHVEYPEEQIRNLLAQAIEVVYGSLDK